MKSAASLSYAFFPDASRAQQLDARMRLQLAESLAYLREAMAAQWDEAFPDLVSLIAGMRAGAAYPPSTFGLYYDLSNALLAGERDEAMKLIRELCAEHPMQNGKPQILTLDEVRPPAAIARYQRLMDTDPNRPFRIKSPSPKSAEAFCRRLDGILKRMDLVSPSVDGEIAQLVRQIVLVVPEVEDLFSSASCYMLWGALLLNVDAFDDDMDLLQALAHESAHTLLFGFTTDDPLVLNDADELYGSPLREDQRPMDGIFHATYVSARMHWAMATALQSGELNPQESASAKRACEENVRNFFEGHDTVMRHGRLSDTGKAIMAGAYDYMKAIRAESGQKNHSNATAH